MIETGDINLITIVDINNSIESMKMIHKEEVKIGFQPIFILVSKLVYIA